jgi:hypothetical protein
MRYDWSLLKRTIKGSLVFDGFDIIVFTYHLEKQEQKYEALWKLIYWDNEIVDWQGTVRSLPHKYSLDAKLKGYFHDPVEVAGDIIVDDNNNMHLSGKLSSNFLRINYSGKSQRSATAFKTSGLLAYEMAGNYSGNLDLSAKLQTIQQGMLRKHSLIFSTKVKK